MSIKPLKPAEINFAKLNHSKLKVKKAEPGRPESKQVRITYDKQELKIRTSDGSCTFWSNTSNGRSKSPSF